MDISIIVPVYNCEKYLSQCIESIRKCKKVTMECILVNDGSTDGSRAICQAAVKKDARFRLIDKENGGVSSARNAGLEQAKGTYVLFQDADDFLMENAFQLFEEAMKREKTDIQAFSSITLFEDGSKKRERFFFPEQESTDMDVAKELVYASSQMNACWGKLFLREMIEKFGIRFPVALSIGEDYVFVAEYFKHCNSAYVSQDPLLYYRQHDESAMHRFSLTERLQYTETLYQYNKRAVEELGDAVLLQKMYNYYVRVLTNLFLKFSKGKSVGNLAEEYKKSFDIACVQEFVDKAQFKGMLAYKKVECVLLKKHMFYLLAVYFKLKAKL